MSFENSASERISSPPVLDLNVSPRPARRVVMVCSPPLAHEEARLLEQAKTSWKAGKEKGKGQSQSPSVVVEV